MIDLQNKFLPLQGHLPLRMTSWLATGAMRRGIVYYKLSSGERLCQAVNQRRCR